MSIIAHGTAQSSNSNGFTTPAFNSTGGGGLGVAAVSLYTATTIALTDNKGNTWTRFVGHAAGGSPTSQLFYCDAPIVGTGHTFTLAFTAQYGCIEYVFLSDVLVHDGTNARAATAVLQPTIKPGSTTPSAANGWLFTHAAANAVGTYSIDSGFTIIDQANFLASTAFGGALAYKTLTTATAQDPTWSNAGNLSSTVIGSFVPGSPLRNLIGGTAGAATAAGVISSRTVLRNLIGSVVGVATAAGVVSVLFSSPTTPTSLGATVVSSSRINLTWTASTGGGGVTGYSVERCEGVGCSSFSEVGAPSSTTFSNTGLLASTSYSYRVRANSPGGYSEYSSTTTAVTDEPAAIGATVVRRVQAQVEFAGEFLMDVLSARGEESADGGWPTCSVVLTAYPRDGEGDPIDEENDMAVIAGASNYVTRFVGRVRRFRPSAFPRGIEAVATGTLAYAAEWAPHEDLEFEDYWPSGATDEALVQWALSYVPGVTYSAGDIGGTGITLGSPAGAPEAFSWRAGMTAWNYIQEIDRATLWRTFQTRDGTIRRVKMIGHPDATEDFVLAPEDILDGATGNRDTERTRNFVRVWGYDYGDGLGRVTNGSGTSGFNHFQGDGGDPATRHTEEFSSNLIESGTDIDDDTWDGNSGLRADQIAEEIIADVNKEFVEASVPSWRDDSHAPGLTCLLDALDRLAIGEKMWVAGYGWEVGDNGWIATYRLTGGGLAPA